MLVDDGVFDGAYCLHVGMNIEDKAALCAEIARVLRPDAVLGIYDILAGPRGDERAPRRASVSRTMVRIVTAHRYCAPWCANRATAIAQLH